jgi:hypothetical protein
VTMTTFRETQRFTQPWLVLLIAAVVIGIWVMFVVQIVLGRPVGDNPAPDWAMWLLLAVFGVAFPLFFASLRLEVEVRPEGLHLRFVPFVRRTIPWGEIASAEARTYRPLAEYGGWGIRGFASNRAYNVRGTRGVQLVLADGKRLLLGSQRADELEAAIRARLGPVA